MFIARISRGRTIRQFVTGVLLVPSWSASCGSAILGGSAIDLQLNGTDIAGAGGLESQLFSTLDAFPLATVTSILVMVLVSIFFVSGADAASIVMGTLSERGTQEPSRPNVIFWGVSTGVVAAVMLLAGGTDALTGLQTITIVAALPFVVVMVGLAVALMKDLRRDPLMVRRQVRRGGGRPGRDQRGHRARQRLLPERAVQHDDGHTNDDHEKGITEDTAREPIR